MLSEYGFVGDMLFLFPGLSHMFWFLIANASSDELFEIR